MRRYNRDDPSYLAQTSPYSRLSAFYSRYII